jgi:two-component system, LytTR family, sensor kinase
VQGALTAVAGCTVYWLLRRRHTSFGTAEQHGTLRTLAFATSSLRELRQGLSRRSAERVLPVVAEQAGADAVAIYGIGGLLAFHARQVSLAEPHRLHLAEESGHVLDAMRAGRLRLLRVHGEGRDGCELRSAAVIPLTVSGEPVAGLVTYHLHQPPPGALRIASDLAELLATQLRLQQAELERVALSRSELRTLQAQISPHFVYNALTTIAAFIRTDPDRARQLVLEFAEFTRRAFRSPQAEFSTLADELVYVNQYLLLEQARLGDRLAVKYQIEPEVLNVTVPTLVLQPLVENAVKHGVEAVRGAGTITLRAEDDNEECLVTVSDDGAGFEPGSDGAEPGALHNVDRRLREVFGAQHGVTLESSPGHGTTVRLRVPKYRPGVRAS